MKKLQIIIGKILNKFGYVKEQKSNVEKVGEWLFACGKTKPNEPQIPNLETQKLVLNIVLEELVELAEAGGKKSSEYFVSHLIQEAAKLQKRIDSGKLKEGIDYYLDSLTDLQVVISNGYYFAGMVHLEKDNFEKVMQSNRTKIDNCYSDALKTQSKYKTKEGEITTMIIQPTENSFVNTRLSDGKIMKSFRWVEHKTRL
jgi:hypothetical protein